MKPIALTIKGLHSFREEQTIDLNSLCDAGVFGIFGPTGSGKSSILDAMTLALYGKVERALNNTHGILNQAEDKLTVSFTFALQKHHEVSYKVERSFKRADEMKVRTTLCRLIEMKDSQTVLADKANEVNRKIEELLGLTIDDFTRAVVLPQGKFAEFLSLKGTERRQMLQRLFNLERYGDQFVKRLRTKAQHEYGRKNELLAELTGLGEAGPEALANAKEAAALAQAEFNQKKQAKDEAVRSFTEAQTIWQWQVEKAKYENEQNHLDTLAPSIEEKKKKLEQAQHAETLKPYADALTRADIQLNQAVREVQQAEKKLQEAQSVYEQINRQYEHHRKLKLVHEPQLLIQKEQLIRLKDVERKQKETQQDKEVLVKRRIEKEQLMKQKKTEAEDVISLLDRALAKQTQLKQELEHLYVSAKERKSVQDAFRFSEDVNRIKMNIQKEEKKLTEWEKKFTRSAEVYERLQKHQVDQHAKLEQSFQSVAQVYYYVCETERALMLFTQKEADHKTEKLKQRDKARADELRKELAADLIEGEPCPVCGSTHHEQQLVSSYDHDLSVTAIDLDIQTIDQALKEAEAHARDIYSTKQSLEKLSDHLVKEFPFLTKKELGAEVAASIDISHSTYSLSDITHEWKGIKQDIQGIETQTFHTIDSCHETEKELRKMEEQMNFEQKQKNEVDISLKEQQSELVEKKDQFKQKFADFPLDQVHDAQKSIEDKDQQSEGYQERIQKSIEFLEDKQRLKEKLQTEVFDLEKELNKLEHQLESTSQSIQQYESELSTYEIKADSISEELLAVEQELSDLNEKEQQHYQKLKQMQQFFNEAQSGFTSSERQQKEAELRKVEAELAWKEASAQSAFKHPQDIQLVLLDRTTFNKMKEEIENFVDKSKQCAANLKRLSEQLNHQSLSEEKWLDIQANKEHAEKALEEATIVSGSANEHLRVTEANHQRFSNIHEQLSELQQEIDRLDKLQTVFKGNTFVEFLAEEQLESVSRDASSRLGILTRQRYAIEVDSEGGFVMRDDANGGVRRPVSSLSGGETFLTSLALALALSAQIQLRGQYPLQFFFLDEGFGTLDQDLLDTVITALEKLQSQNLAVGVISHVEELKMRLPKKLIVHPAEPSGKGTTVSLELM
ncbi:exonuclease subunit SbcC [Bacillus sp. NPDC077027]|uniref:exonuclease subunit SbcC n=1 Tax=Bacillus sp. NPDC077027 TaxID=3390548 RepID=UPI003CFC4F56